VVQAYHKEITPFSKFFIFLISKVVASSPHSMGLERVIGLYEMIKCNVRVNLDPATVNDIIFVKMNMPVTSQIDLRPIVWDFINKKERRNRIKNFDLEKSMKQEYFKTFFPGVPYRRRKVRNSEESDWSDEESSIPLD
jgi:hypothetical protein